MHHHLKRNRNWPALIISKGVGKKGSEHLNPNTKKDSPWERPNQPNLVRVTSVVYPSNGPHHRLEGDDGLTAKETMTRECNKWPPDWDWDTIDCFQKSMMQHIELMPTRPRLACGLVEVKPKRPNMLHSWPRALGVRATELL
jgi:hypothetical protein